jgi:hypothetical protein
VTVGSPVLVAMVMLGAGLADGTEDGETVGNLVGAYVSPVKLGREDGYTLGTSVGAVLGISDG